MGFTPGIHFGGGVPKYSWAVNQSTCPPSRTTFWHRQLQGRLWSLTWCCNECVICRKSEAFALSPNLLKQPGLSYWAAVNEGNCTFKTFLTQTIASYAFGFAHLVACHKWGMKFCSRTLCHRNLLASYPPSAREPPLKTKCASCSRCMTWTVTVCCRKMTSTSCCDNWLDHRSRKPPCQECAKSCQKSWQGN